MFLGAAAGCNAGAFLGDYRAAGYEMGISEDDLRAAIEAARVVKKGAAMFMDREAERVLKPVASASPPEGVPAGDCGCGSDCG